MIFSKTTILAIGLLAQRISASPLASGEVPYPLTDGVWTISNVTGDGSEHQFTGTIQEAEKKIRDLNPSFDLTSRSEHAVEERATWWHCDWPPSNPEAYGLFAAKGLTENINTLKGKPSNLHFSVPAQSCARAACAWNVAVVMCNSAGTTNLQPVNDLGKYADMIKQFCMYTKGSVVGEYVKGQFFDRKNYNVIVRGDTC